MNVEQPIGRSEISGNYSLTEKRIVLVEGKDEHGLLSLLAKHLNITTIQVLDIAGKTKLRSNLNVVVKSREFLEVEVLGVMQDADPSAVSALQRISNDLVSVGLTAPTESLQLSNGNPKVIVMITPNGEQKGMLEDVCLESIGGQPVMTCVNDYFDCLKENSIEWPNNMSKAKMTAFLASRPEHEKLSGQVTWDWDHPAFESIRNFLQLVVSA